MEFKRLGDIATFINGHAFKPEDWGSKGFPIIRIQNLTNSSNEMNYFEGEIAEKYIVNKGDILIAWSASLGVYEWERETAVLNQHIFKVVFDKIEINKSYFKYMVSLALNNAIKYLHGSTMKHLTKKYFDDIKIPFPSLKQQTLISEALNLNVSLINMRQSQIEALDELTQSIFLEMFGDPLHNPKRWEKGKIADLTESTQYGTSSKANEGAGEFPILRMNNITYKGGWDFSNLKYIDLDEKEQKKYLVHKGDLLFNRTNSKELVGKTAVYRNDIPYAYAGYLVKLIPNAEANAEFISAYLNSGYGKRILLNKAKSIVGMANINAQELKSIDIYLPPKKSQDDYAYKIQSILKYQEQLKDSLESYNNLYNSLLQRAFKGELFQEQV
ncbi:restriction endonuclease subunit S [Bacillus cereus group sp. BcHK130]|uniref:restriction endonuclease subunit S n=1 Tax=Bacillus cereus group sp. BcHK130 TaxID=3018093 RepID=UPI0022E6D43B|nr:restriction endonuclease subunit S [Bacillus cereus group sp. BcHK130]MDA1930469.1 restriction endonuclease subunit S [Bacillus cereus group sp. BcHK130]